MKRSLPFCRHAGRLALLSFALTLCAGCAELVAEGNISDRETSAPVPDVQILQSRAGENWISLGRTDGRGAYWVLKSRIYSGSRIRFKKPGYFPLEMLDNEFVTTSSHLITPTGSTPGPRDAAEPTAPIDSMEEP